MKEEDWIDWRLLVRILDLSATDEEKIHFRKWMEKDPERENYFKRAKADWQQGGIVVREDVEETFKLLLQRMHSEESNTTGIPVKKKHKRLRIFRWATIGTAACIVLYCTLYVIHHHIQVQASYETVLSEQIHPGIPKATLLLDDGSVIRLDDGPFVLNWQGISIRNDSCSNLSYLGGEESDVRYNRLVVPHGGYYGLTLSDGSIIWLNSGSELRYPTQFSGDSRRVELQGEAFFRVAPNSQQPFIVDAGDYHVEVLGTEFNLSAYSDDTDKITTLVRGKVNVIIDSLNQQEILLPGMQLTYNQETKSKTIEQVNTETYTSWKEGNFEFMNTSFEKLIKIVSRWYDFEYKIIDPSLRNYHFTGAFKKSESIDDLFRILKSSKIPVEITYDGKTILFKKRTINS